FLMQSFNPDEQVTIAILERIKSQGLRPDPGTYSYGGLYIYSAGAFLYFSSVVGAVTLTSDISYYFLHPEEMRKIYVIFKLWGMLFTSLTVFLIFYAGSLIFSRRAGLFAAFFYSITPGVMIDGNLMKPYGFSLFWSMLAFIFMILFVKEGREKLFYLASVFLGFALGSIYIHVFMMPAFLAAVYFSTSNEKKLSLLIKGSLLVLGAFLITNPYFVPNIKMVYKELLAATGAAPFKISFYNAAIYFLATLPAELSAGIYVFCLLGLWKILRTRTPEMIVLCAAFVPAAVYISFSHCHYAHYSVTLVPFAVLAAGYFADFLWREHRRWGQIALGAVFALSMLNASYYLYLWLKEDTRISAGKWINDNIPSGSSIAAGGNFTGMEGYPAFRMWDYDLKPQIGGASKKDFRYYIWIENKKGGLAESSYFDDNFEQVRRYKNNIGFFEKIFFTKHIVKNYGKEIVIYKRK
ncbi:glycosyltransferase family 39 protein, partial [bacterium]|nr:glycosyltransferase family 39 protein [bacterium]